jgi:nucleotide-binding universal stress UspA family protein
MYRKLLVATDGSELATKAVTHGVNLARETGASIVFVTVTEPWIATEMAGEAVLFPTDPTAAYEKASAEGAQRVLAAAKAVADGAGVKSEGVHIADRPPAEGIVETADKVGADLIVVATHGRRGFNRILLGSQTTEVLHYSKVPVLAVR